MTTELPSQIGLAAAASYFIQYLKNSPKFSWISQHSSGLNRALATLTALAASVGVHYTYTHTDEGTWIVTFTGLTLASVGHYTWAWFTQFAIQQGYFAAVVKQPDIVKTVGPEGIGQAAVAVPPSAAGAVPAKDKP